MTKSTLERPEVCGIPIDNITLRETVERTFEEIEAFSRDQRPRYIATVNLDFYRNCFHLRSFLPKNPRLIHSLRESTINTADGMPVLWLSRLSGIPLKERVAGSDLILELSQKAALKGKSVYLFGGHDGLAVNAAKILQNRYHGLRIAGTSNQQVSVEGELNALDKNIIDQINASKADILFIGLGSPKQEIWFDRIRSQLKIPISIGIGGSFSFVTNEVKRAPAWMQRSGLEWLYRIYREPKRLWKRYLLDGVHLIGMMARSLYTRLFCR